jgi:acetyl esterase
MPLDPQARLLLDQFASTGARPLHMMAVPEARQLMETLRAMSPPGDPVAHVEDRTVPGAVGEIPVRLYHPGGGTQPLLVYFHGGGWVLGSLESHDSTLRDLCNASGCAILAVDYRLAPETRFPAAAEDCFAATGWVAANASSLGGDPGRLAVAGDSAGGNLAAVVSQLARDRGGPRIAFQLLLCPATEYGFDTASYRDNADGYLLTRNGMVWFWHHYLADPAAQGRDTRASPMRAQSLAGLPPAHVVTAEYDPLRDEGEAYASKLRQAGVPVTARRYDGQIHNFFTMGHVLAQGEAAAADVCGVLRRALGAGRAGAAEPR